MAWLAREWTGRRRLPAALVLLALLGVTAWEFPHAMLDAKRAVAATARLTAAERRAADARPVDLDERALFRAEELIPPEATFSVITGSGVEVSSPVVLTAVRPFAAYWLLPRREHPEPTRADWILSYGGDLGGLGLRYARVVEIAPGIALAEVQG